LPDYGEGIELFFVLPDGLPEWELALSSGYGEAGLETRPVMGANDAVDGAAASFPVRPWGDEPATPELGEEA